MKSEYDFDVAFSFLASDEPIAVQLADALGGEVKVFLYSEQQKLLAGTDGERTFNSVFGQKSRTVVILYRKGWGSTPWTRIEETSIRNRAFDFGYDFALLIPLDKPATKREWFPQNRLWIGLERWGFKGAAAVIEARVQELGGTPRRESLEDRAARHEREISYKRERESALNSYEGVAAFHEAIKSTRAALQDGVRRINEGRQIGRLAFKAAPHELGPCAVTGLRYALSVEGRAAYANTLSDSRSEATIWKDGLPWPGYASFNEPVKRGSLKFNLDYSPSRRYAWKITNTETFLTPDELAEEILKWYLENGGDPF